MAVEIVFTASFAKSVSYRHGIVASGPSDSGLAQRRLKNGFIVIDSLSKAISTVGATTTKTARAMTLEMDILVINFC